MKKADLSFSIGEYITAYKKGIHECIEIVDRWYSFSKGKHYDVEPVDVDTDDLHYCPLITYVPMFNEKGKPINPKRRPEFCDGSYCRLAIDVAKENLETAQYVYDLLK